MLGLAGPEVHEQSCRGHPAREDAEEAELAHEQVVGRLEDLGDQLAVLVRLELDVVVVVSRAVAVDVGRGQAAVGQDVEQLLEPDVLARRDADDRNELARGRSPGAAASRSSADGECPRLRGSGSSGRRRSRRSARRPSGRPRRGASGSRRGRPRAGFITSMMPEKRGPLADRDVERHALGAEGLADRLEDAEVVDVVGVHLGQGDDPAELEPGGLVEDAPGVDLDAGRAPRPSRRRSRRRPGRSGRCR